MCYAHPNISSQTNKLHVFPFLSQSNQSFRNRAKRFPSRSFFLLTLQTYMDTEREILIDLVRLIHTLGCISGELRGLKTICDAKEEDVFLLDSVSYFF